MKISDIAKAVDLPISTIRYYEKMGLIPNSYMRRDENNYRQYNSEIISHLKILKTTLSVGFTINELKLILSRNEFSEEQRLQEIRRKLLKIEDTQKKLTESKKYLQDALGSDYNCEEGFAKRH
ncbi:MerR family transcriptional regulator [Bacillus sp. JCM 19041]|uniref:MerR family transcriptional regulator n=1 Tax=Bacillus sp. JCM 19041 TaxID=1460637 RepID=UPI0006D0A59C